MTFFMQHLSSLIPRLVVALEQQRQPSLARHSPLTTAVFDI